MNEDRPVTPSASACSDGHPEEAAWQRLTVEAFFAGYDEADAVYDEWPKDENVPAG